MKQLFALIAVAGMTAGLAGCPGEEEPVNTPDTSAELGDPGVMGDPAMPDDSGSTTGDDHDHDHDDGESDDSETDGPALP